ncbi:KilA-N domain-containing protein [Azotobacter chroococcum]|uniref:KilA-N domain-containing protein n=1 Tax=Azotobacter chroococcum TaxID=353 RepID=UPI0010AE7438|nr:KilA-N domain-containing protein [Azotobacter chroococcum]TKD44228.1 hypothetical protein FCG41_07495 [Azotobacter chroococcum]
MKKAAPQYQQSSPSQGQHTTSTSHAVLLDKASPKIARIIPFDYEGQPVRFNAEGWLHATEIAERFGKRLDHWLENAETLEYVRALDEIQHPGAGPSAISNTRKSGYLKTRRGNNGGTWLHPKLAVAFARWISPRFAVWCDMQIEALIHQGMAVQGHEHLIGLLLRPEASGWERRFPPEYYHALAKVTNTHYEGHAGGTPAVFGQITRRLVYQVIMPPTVLLELEGRCGTREKLHQWLTDGGSKVLDSQIARLTLIANTSTDLPDFEARCMQAFGLPGQLRIVYPLVG